MVVEPESTYAAPSTATEAMLAELWSEVLGVQHVGVDDNFFSLGGDSLMAAGLFAKTTRWTGKTMPLSLLFSSPTIRQVAKALDDYDGANEATVVALRAGGTKPPLFLAHGVTGELFEYLLLVRLLGPEQPVYGFRLTKALTGTEPRLRIPDLAGDYISDLLRVQPTGPYRLGGFCFGGLVAVEIAHQLEQLGHEVALVALFDTDLPTSLPESRAHREVAQLVGLLRRDESIRTYAQRRVENARTKARHSLLTIHDRFGAHASLLQSDVARRQYVAESPLWDLLKPALASYVAPQTDCPIVYFGTGVATAPASLRELSEESETDRIYVVDGPGISHGALMFEPHIHLITSVLEDCLEQSDRSE